jgi:hypothetical protein
MRMLSECTAVMGCVFDIDVTSFGFVVFPAPFCITRCFCCCWLSGRVPGVKVCCLFL